jgi:hypothetical protein
VYFLIAGLCALLNESAGGALFFAARKIEHLVEHWILTLASMAKIAL